MTRASLVAVVIALTANTAEVRRDARDPDLLVAHEWGTFTTVAGKDGEPLEWLPLEGAQDLPCFVERFGPRRVKAGLAATVRMETPVIYFYAPRAMTVDVAVRFPRGLVTEWFPRARVTPESFANATMKARGFASTATWTNVRIVPGSAVPFPTESRDSHYYAARATDAAPLRVGTQAEKFLFYRGVAVADLPVSARVADDGQVVVSSRTGTPLGTIVRFDRRDEALGFEVRRIGGATASFVTPASGASLETLTGALEQALVREGLYAREARAMIATWTSSWFENGTRVFYVLPRAAVDALLPLDIRPRPSDVARVFVGRIELITAETMTEVRRALQTRDRGVLRKYGRFVLPIAKRVLDEQPVGWSRTEIDQFVYGTFTAAAGGGDCAAAGQ